MKNVFLFVLLALLMMVAPVLGQEAEVKNLSDVQLQNLYEVVKAEMSRRGLNAFEKTLAEGKYIIGKDIPAGSYTITCTSTDGESLGGVYNSLGSAYDSLSGGGDSWANLFGAFGGLMEDISELQVEIIGDYGDVLKKYTLKKDSSVDIILQEGTALKISEGSAKIVSN